MNWLDNDIQKVAKSLAPSLYLKVRSSYALDDIFQEFYLVFLEAHAAWDQENTGPGALVVLFRTACKWRASKMIAKNNRDFLVPFSVIEGAGGEEFKPIEVADLSCDPAGDVIAQSILDEAPECVQQVVATHMVANGKIGHRGNLRAYAKATNTPLLTITANMEAFRKELLAS